MVLALFESLGGSELFIVGVAALLVFGKRLPEVAAQTGKQIAKLRHGLDKSWKDTGLEKEIADIKQVLPDVAPSELARTASRRFQQRLADKARREGLDPAAQFEQEPESATELNSDIPGEDAEGVPQSPGMLASPGMLVTPTVTPTVTPAPDKPTT
jgi:Sec-independent protein translocase protein TatA